jgi:FHS family Na+ dependent glucose MFS transporter 1
VPVSTVRTSTISRTTGYYGAMATFGLLGAAWGPALPFLASSTGTDLARIGLIFTALALGGFMGTTLGGRSYDKVPGHAIMTAALIIMASAAALIPLVTMLWLLLLLVFILGSAAGLMTVGANTLLVWVHQDNVGPWLNGLHFFSGIGAIIAPLIIVIVVSTSEEIKAAFWIMAFIILIPAAWLLVVKSPAIRQASDDEPGGQIIYKLVIPISIIFLLYVGAEVAFAGWLFTNTITLHPGNESMAGYLTIAFWVAFTAGRLVAIPLSTRISSRSILLIDFAGCLISLGLILALSASLAALWLGTIGLGLFMAAIFPTMLTFSEHRLRLSGKVSGIIFGASALGGMTVPLLIGQVFEAAGSRATMMALFIDLLIALVVFAAVEYSLNRGVTRVVSR